MNPLLCSLSTIGWRLFLSLFACSGEKESLGVQFSEPADKSVFESGASFYVVAYATAPEMEAVSVLWHSSIYGNLFETGPPEDDGRIYGTLSNLEDGEHLLSLVLQDGTGAVAQDSITVFLGDAYMEDPSLDLLHASQEQGLEDTSFLFQAEVSDLRDAAESLTVAFTSAGEALCSAAANADGEASCEVVLPIGDYSVLASVTDSDGNNTEKSFDLYVVARADYDADGDGFSPNQDDCDDDNSNTYPGARESCDGIDNDCDETTPMEVGSDCWDDDGDGFCEVPPCLNSDEMAADCDDDIPEINPDENEIPNGYDDDCDGDIDDGTVYFDDDGDGFCELPPCTNTDEMRSDCIDSNPAVHPDAEEVCGDDLDNNCNGDENEQDAVGCERYYLDEDGDGFGVTGARKCYCSPGKSPYTGLDNGDCYDQNPDANPLQSEWFTEDRGDGSFDYDCSGDDELRWQGISDGCDAGFLSSFGLQCEPDGIGWLDDQPDCGEGGWWLSGCSSDIPVLCIVICAATGNLASCLECGAVCTGSIDAQDQECR